MKPIVRGKNIYFREVEMKDAEFILALRTDPVKNRFLSKTSNNIESQRDYISNYKKSKVDYYFIISNWNDEPIGTIRIYDTNEKSFCWGSWILKSDVSSTAALESSLLLYDFAFYSLHFKNSHFDVRKENTKVINFHKRFGAVIIKEDSLDYFFSYSIEKYKIIREKYIRYIE